MASSYRSSISSSTSGDTAVVRIDDSDIDEEDSEEVEVEPIEISKPFTRTKSRG